jgi:hypothetical protein
MAVTPLTPTQLSHTAAVDWPADPGVAANAVDGNSVPNGGNTLLVMNNSGAVSRTVTVAVAKLVDGLAVEGREFTLAAGEVKVAKLGSVDVYGSTTLVTASHAEVLLAAFAL